MENIGLYFASLLVKKKMSKSNIIKIILIVFFLQLFVTGCAKYCRNLMLYSSDKNHVTMIMEGSYNKCFIKKDVLPKANRHCNVFGKGAIYQGQRRIYSGILIDFNCKGNEPVYKNQQKKRIKPREIPEDLFIIEPSEVL